MSHLIDQTTGQDAIAYVGETPWHGLGAQLTGNETIEEWAVAAGLNWTADMCDAYFGYAPKTPYAHTDTHKFLVRSDTKAVLGVFTPQYKPVQPKEVLEFFRDYITLDDRFRLEVAGALKGGAQIWSLAKFTGDADVMGEKHAAYCLLTTSFDGSMATTAQATMVRVVCNNTLTASLWDKSSTVKVRHNTNFNGARVAHDLETVAAGFDQYRVMAEALAVQRMSREDTSNLFKQLLDIPFDVKEMDVSSRKMNQFRSLSSAYAQTVQEGTEPDSKWAVLNAVTRYADHEKSAKTGSNGSEAAARLHSANFGTGARMKSQAIELLMPRDDRARVLMAA